MGIPEEEEQAKSRARQLEHGCSRSTRSIRLLFLDLRDKALETEMCQEVDTISPRTSRAVGPYAQEVQLKAGSAYHISTSSFYTKNRTPVLDAEATFHEHSLTQKSLKSAS